MKYMLLIYQGTTPLPPSPEWDALPSEKKREIYAAYGRSTRSPATRRQRMDGDTATTVRVEDGRTLVTDGPFVELKEAVGGYCFLEADNIDAAIELAAGSRRQPGRRGRDPAARGVLAILDQVFREQWGRVLAALIGYLGDFDLAEEAAQEAFAIAADRWPRDGVPSSPATWLITTARNRAIDRLRRERTLVEKTRLLEVPRRRGPMDETPFPDERLELVFTCCHPALSTEAQVALTLRTLGGLTTPEIARAFLVPEATMAQRLVRPRRRSRRPASRSACRPTTCCPTASRPCSRSST
jgi:RNA polymerase sigma factor (sigma-70 family)